MYLEHLMAIDSESFTIPPHSATEAGAPSGGSPPGGSPSPKSYSDMVKDNWKGVTGASLVIVLLVAFAVYYYYHNKKSEEEDEMTQ